MVNVAQGHVCIYRFNRPTAPFQTAAPLGFFKASTRAFNKRQLQASWSSFPSLFAILSLLGETESGSAGKQPDKG